MKKLALLKKTLLFFIPAVLAAGVLITLLYRTDVETEKHSIEFDESLLLKLDSRIIRNELQRLVSDVSFFTSDQSILEIAKTPDPELNKTLSKRFLNFLKEQGRYGRMSLINLQGMETIRVDFSRGVSAIASEEELQSNAGKDYFKETLRLGPGLVYFSPFNLNQGGGINKPFNLSIRIGMPLIDELGQKQGILVLSYLGEILLDQLYQVRIEKAEKHMLIESKGYWIDSTPLENGRSLAPSLGGNITFLMDYPKAWGKIKRTDAGNFYTKKGLFSFITVKPTLEFQVRHSGQVQSDEEEASLNGVKSWKLISFVPQKVLTEKPQEILKSHLVLFSLYSSIIAIGSFALAFALLKRENVDKALEEREERIRSIVETAPDGILAIDHRGIIDSINPAALKIFRYEPGEITGKRIDVLIPEIYWSKEGLAISSDNETNLHVAIGIEREVTGLRKDGTTFPLEITLSKGQQGETHFFTGIVRDIAGRKELEEKIRHDALYDSLTSLPNRTLLLDRLARCIKHASRRDDYLFAVLFLDLDRFKGVNDSLGHMIGDQLLIEVSERLSVCVRSRDTISRLGGDEIGILLEDINDIGDATFIADRIHESMKKPFNIQGNELYNTISIGIALSSTGYKLSEEILRDADIAMYRAKAAGGARYDIFDGSMREMIIGRQKLEKDLRRAVDSNELVLYYQPITSIASGRIVSFEALVRWQHPERGLIFPDEFIPIAEETGLVVALGTYVFRTACRQMRIWQDLYPSYLHIGMSVNLSGKQLGHPDLIQEIDAILEETKCDPTYLKLEITETILMENSDAVKKILLQLKRMNFNLYIDDFGVGYSSLSYLHQFPFDALKIDRSFTSKLTEGETNIKIVKTIISLADELGLDVITEGIETAEQLEILRNLGCKFGQGYLFSKAVDANTASLMITQDLDKRYAIATD